MAPKGSGLQGKQGELVNYGLAFRNHTTGEITPNGREFVAENPELSDENWERFETSDITPSGDAWENYYCAHRLARSHGAEPGAAGRSNSVARCASKRAYLHMAEALRANANATDPRRGGRSYNSGKEPYTCRCCGWLHN